MPALAPGVRLMLLLRLWEEVDCWGGGNDCAVEADIEDVTEVDGIFVPEDADVDRDLEVADKDMDIMDIEVADEDRDVAVVDKDMDVEVADEDRDVEVVDKDMDVEVVDDEGVKVAAARTDDGIEDNSCILLGSGLPPTLPSSSSPHVLGSTLSLDVMSKVGVLAQSSPEKLSTCMWQMPFCS